MISVQTRSALVAHDRCGLPDHAAEPTLREGTAVFPGLKMPEFGPYDASMGISSVIFRRCVLVIGLVVLGVVLDGCTKCGPIWDDWIQPPKSCRSDHL
jgi:hypothetical protein